MNETETEEQKKVRERLVRHIAREQLVSVMNDTKWAKLQTLMLELEDSRPPFRVRCLGDKGEWLLDQRESWDYDWNYHLPAYIAIEWLDIDPAKSQRDGRLVGNKKTEHNATIIDLLKMNHIPFSIEGDSIRVWGYHRPGQDIIFC